MGGKNHQPCNQPQRNYLTNSTILSQALSRGLAELELANVGLEDLILAELAGGPTIVAIREGRISDMVVHLIQSYEAMSGALAALDRLEAAMEDFRFQDLPTLHTLDLSQVGDALADAGVVDRAVWAEVVLVYRRGGFRTIAEEFRKEILQLKGLTLALAKGVETLAPAAKEGRLTLILEENRPGNIKLAFGALYTAWHRFSLRFLTSSLLSTELWYAHKGFGSLIGERAAAFAEKG